MGLRNDENGPTALVTVMEEILSLAVPGVNSENRDWQRECALSRFAAAVVLFAIASRGTGSATFGNKEFRKRPAAL
jgi:hypothetical protein